ncbi:hypothetical protein BJ322DRAFT_1017297 [Thelephora terrestris]|uniref:Uncharacterized protein n=1 Tax=Thelephora terrestris TaxID=56493 RepID=A0A9P6LB85_9AGAM|nr:hypothetical protein BJ322DRAFT_1017297 [Thelephora terrestris]
MTTETLTLPTPSTPSSLLPSSNRPLGSNIDKFGLSRFYPIKPSTIPYLTKLIFEEGTAPTPMPAPPKRRKLREILNPYPNLGSFLFDHQFRTSSESKSRKDRNALRDVIVHKEFNPSDLEGVNFDAIEKDLRQTGGSGWRETPLTIRVPNGVKKAVKRAAATEQSRLQSGEPSTATLVRPVPGVPVTIHDFQHREFCDIIRETLSSDPAPTCSTIIHMSSNSEERVHGKLYTSQAWLDENAKVQFLTLDPTETDQEVPRAIAAIMLASDATGLGQFASSKVWPIYVFLGNQLKYDRAKPTQHAAHHLALPFVS